MFGGRCTETGVKRGTHIYLNTTLNKSVIDVFLKCRIF